MKIAEERRIKTQSYRRAIPQKSSKKELGMASKQA
jgi:hypothetical protein